MDIKDDYKSIWLTKIDEFKKQNAHASRYNTMLSRPQELAAELDGAISRAIERLSINPDAKPILIRAVYDDPAYVDAKSVALGILNRHRDLLNVEKQTTRADLETKIRFLIFRILTAIGIAAVILGTAYIAQKAGISISLVRV